jgi:hypothetical protein
MQSRTLFLAAGDVLRLPADELKAYLTSLTKVFPIQSNPGAPSTREREEGPGEGSSDLDRMPSSRDASPQFDGVHIFLDDFARGGHGRGVWTEYAALGIKRVSVGIVSGDPGIRALYHQQGSNQNFRETFADLKSAGIGASVLTLVGAGGTEQAQAHVKQTADLITSLDLAPGDFVFLLDENELRNPGDLPQLTPLHGEAWQQEQTKLKEALASLKERKIKVLPYTMEKQGI